VQKYRKDGQAKYNKIWRVRLECWLPKDTEAHLEYVILNSFSTETIFTRTNFSVTLCVHCLTCLTHLEVSTRTNSRASQLACRDNSHRSLHLLSEILVAVEWRK
jgi:hypothetical protein